MIPSVRPAAVCLKISAYIYYFFAVLSLIFLFAPTGESFSKTTAILIVISAGLMGYGVTKLAQRLTEGRRWAWGVSYALSLLYLSSAFFPLGLIQLYGLLRQSSYVQFHLTTKRSVFIGIAIFYGLLVMWVIGKINAT